MDKTKLGLTAAALAAISTQAFASAPLTIPPAAEHALPAVTSGTGLTPADLLVGRDGTIAFDVNAHGVKVAACTTNAGSCTTNNGCC